MHGFARGDPFGMTNLAMKYEEGKGVARDCAQARAWFQKAAEAGGVAAMYSLGLLYKNGKGGARDNELARTWLQKAADAGQPFARQRLLELKEQ